MVSTQLRNVMIVHDIIIVMAHAANLYGLKLCDTLLSPDQYEVKTSIIRHILNGKHMA